MRTGTRVSPSWPGLGPEAGYVEADRSRRTRRNHLQRGGPYAELKARLAKTIDYCKTFKPAQIDGTEDKDISIKLGAMGQGLLQNFILPNFYFHCTTEYDILRHCGVELSKRDFMSTPVNP